MLHAITKVHLNLKVSYMCDDCTAVFKFCNIENFLIKFQMPKKMSLKELPVLNKHETDFNRFSDILAHM